MEAQKMCVNQDDHNIYVVYTSAPVAIKQLW